MTCTTLSITILTTDHKLLQPMKVATFIASDLAPMLHLETPDGEMTVIDTPAINDYIFKQPFTAGRVYGFASLHNDLARLEINCRCYGQVGIENRKEIVVVMEAYFESVLTAYEMKIHVR